MVGRQHQVNALVPRGLGRPQNTGSETLLPAVPISEEQPTSEGQSDVGERFGDSSPIDTTERGRNYS